mgnify:CR=1 FL=1
MWRKLWKKIFGADVRNASLHSERPSIALIDDEEDVCRVVRMALRARGIEVDVAHDGVSGLQMIRRHPPSLILLDIKMPGMNGYQVLAELQKDTRLSTIPVIVLTSLTEASEQSDAKWTERLGIRKLITKPFDPDELARQVQEVLGEDASEPIEDGR